jgi:hypothetical protein
MADDGLVDQVKRRDKNPELMDWIILWAQAISEMERMQEKLIRIQKIHEDAEIAAQLNRLMTDVSIKNLGDRVQRLEDSLSKLKK